MNLPAHPNIGSQQSSPSEFLKLETVCCPLCQCDRFRLVMTGKDHIYHVPGTFQIVRCSGCGHAYMNPRPIFADIMKCYPSDYAPYQFSDPEPEDSIQNTSETAPAQKPWYLKKWARSVPGLRALYYWVTADRSTFIPEIESQKKRALEIGCSTGEFLQKLRAKDWQVQGVELAEQAARIARRRGFEVHTGTLESAALEPESFEAIFLYMVLEHLQDPKGSLKEVYRLLVPGGWMVFSVPNFACLERVLIRDYSLGVQLPRHLQHFSPRHLRSLLAEMGFQEVQILHQRNVNNIVSGLGIWLREKCPRWGFGQRLIDFADNPTLVGTVLLSPFAKLAAWLRQGGRLTVIARKPESAQDAPPG